jgi:cytochrome c-type biogenesis protein CcmH
MTTFWILATLLSVIASGFIFVPLLLSGNRTQATDQSGDDVQSRNLHRNEANVSIYRERLAELESGRDSGDLSDEEFAVCKAELEQTLLSDASDAQTIGDEHSGSRWIPIGAACAIPLMAILLYADWGASMGSMADVELAQQLQLPERAPHEQRNMDVALASLQERLAEQPDNHEAWFLLARSMLTRGSYVEAVEAFDHLLISFPEDAALLSNQAQAMYLADGRRVTARVKKIMDEALSLDPNSPNVMEILGMDAFKRREYQVAIDYFNKMLRLGLGEEHAESIRDLIAQASAQLPGGAAQKQQASATKSLDVLVEIDAEIAVSKDDVVFVFARAAQGPPMPLVAKKLTVADLPTLVRLDDSMSMNPNFTLATVKEVQIVARVAVSGDVVAKSGDWQAISAPLTLDQDHSVIKLRISEAVQ